MTRSASSRTTANFRLSPLDEALRMAPASGFVVVSIKSDWKTVFA